MDQKDNKRPESLAGYFLISESNMGDPNFYKTVVLIIEHNKEGAFGLVVNRKSRLLLSDVVQDLKGSNVAAQNSLYVGGPVQQDYLFVVHDEMPNNHVPSDSNTEVTKNVIFEPAFSYVKNYFDDSFMQEIPVDDHPKLNLYLGYSGWGAGQLESEMDRGSWMIHPANATIVFTQNPEKSWKEALKAKGGIYKIFAESNQQPSLN